MKATITATVFFICAFYCDGIQWEPIVDETDSNLLLSRYREFDLDALSGLAARNQSEKEALEAAFVEKFINEIKINAIKDSSKLLISSKMGSVSEEHDPNVALNVLKTFGHLIFRVKIDYEGIDGAQRVLINQQLSEFCAKSLFEIHLIHCNDHDFVDLLGPFEKVETVHLRFGHLKENKSRFDQVFPSVKQLNLGEMHSVHPGYVEHHFIHLKHLVVESRGKDDLSTVEKRLKLNPQLQTVSLHQCSWNILKLMSETMYDLESVEINEFNDFSPYVGDDIRFEHLKVFRFKKFSALLKSMPKIPLVFGNLEEIECTKPMHLWFEIIMQNKKLRKVSTGEIKTEQLFQIAEELPNLEDFSTAYNTYDATNKVVRFIQKGKHLKRVAFWQSNFNSRNAIAEQLGNGWRIAEDGGRFVFIKH